MGRARGILPVMRLLTERSQRWLVGALAGLPSFVWTVHGAGFLSDDWPVLATVRKDGFLRSLWAFSFVAPARPGAALYYSTFAALFDVHPALYGVLLTALNVIVALELAALAVRLLPQRLAILSVLFWVVLPNRGSTRFWLVLAPDLVALALLLGAGLCLTGGRLRRATALLIAGTLCYEAVLPLGLAMIASWAALEYKRRLRPALAAAAPVLIAGAFIFLRSPKRVGERAPLANWRTLISAQIGRGTFGAAPIAKVGSAVILGMTAVAAVRMTFPSFRAGRRPHHLFLLLGHLVALLGAASFLFAGFPFATDGIFDRGNLVADLGTALVLGCIAEGVLKAAGRSRLGRDVVAVSIGTLAAYLTALNGVDLRAYTGAVADGDALLAALDADVPRIPAGGLRVEPNLRVRDGVAMFIAPGDLASAEEVRRRQPVAEVFIESSPAVPGSSLPVLGHSYDRITRRLSLDTVAHTSPP